MIIFICFYILLGFLVLYIHVIFLLELLELLRSFVLTKRSYNEMSPEEVREDIKKQQDKQEQIKDLENKKLFIKKSQK